MSLHKALSSFLNKGKSLSLQNVLYNSKEKQGEKILMRLWHYKLFPYLPDLQFKGQLREVVAIMHTWRDQGNTNSLIINPIMDYEKSELTSYYLLYEEEYEKRYNKRIKQSIGNEFLSFIEKENYVITRTPFFNFHNKAYLRVCMANLYEKHFCAKGKTVISNEDWKRLTEGYLEITGEKYKL